MTFWQTNYNS